MIYHFCLGSVWENCLQSAEVILLQLFLDCQRFCPPPPTFPRCRPWLMVCSSQSTVKGEDVFPSVHTCFLPSSEMCAEKSLQMVQLLYSSQGLFWSAETWSNSSLVRVGRGPHVGAHMHVIFEECAVMWVWRERAGPLSLPVGAAEGNMCSVSSSSSVWVLKTKLNRNQLFWRVVIFSCHLVTFFNIC